jgi:hypothetical protein
MSAYPWPWNLIAYSILGAGWLVVVVFLARYTTTEPWFSTDAGRHLVSFSANVGAFFTLWLVLTVFPDLPFQGPIRFILLIAIVSNCVWRLVILVRTQKQV